jgi:choline dehydrogenase-like flavoprotein
VVDSRCRAFGYENLLVCDGSVVPANPGVNPSLTITALAEHAMSHVPAAMAQTPKIIRSSGTEAGAGPRDIPELEPAEA